MIPEEKRSRINEVLACLKRLFSKKAFTGWMGISLICCVGIGIYSNTFYVPFQFDDDYVIKNNVAIRNPGNIKLIWQRAKRRFLPYFSFSLNFHFNKFNVFGYHVVNLVIHIGAAILVRWFVLLLFSAPKMKGRGITSYAGVLALFAGLVFISHPVQIQAVTYISQRTSSMAVFFYLAALCAYLKFRLLIMSGYRDKMVGIHFFFFLITAILGAFTKEVIITLPFMILICELYFFRLQDYVKRKYFLLGLFCLGSIPIGVMLTQLLSSGKLRQISKGWRYISPLNYILTQFRVLVTYLRLLFAPVGLNIDYDYPIARGITDIPVLASVLLIFSILYVAIKVFPKYKLISFSIVSFFIVFIPEFTVIPLYFFIVNTPRDAIFLHRLYLPMIGGSLFIVCAIYYIFQKKPIRYMYTALIAMVSFFSVLTYSRNFVWSDELTLWEDALRKSPQKARPYRSLGYIYDKLGNKRKAIYMYAAAIGLDPTYALAYNNLGTLYIDKGDVERAVALYKKALKFNPTLTAAFLSLGDAYNLMDRQNEAIEEYKKALNVDPYLPQVYNNLGTLYSKIGKKEEAIEVYKKAIKVDPYYPVAYNNLASIYTRDGRLEDAIVLYKEAIKIKPGLAIPYYNLGNIYSDSGRIEEAIAQYRKAIELDPAYAQAYNNLGTLYISTGKVEAAMVLFQKALQRDPNYAIAHKNLAHLYYAQKKYEPAIEHCSKAMELGCKIEPDFFRRLKSLKR